MVSSFNHGYHQIIDLAPLSGRPSAILHRGGWNTEGALATGLPTSGTTLASKADTVAVLPLLRGRVAMKLTEGEGLVAMRLVPFPSGSTLRLSTRFRSS
jgi:hypothetical protein